MSTNSKIMLGCIGVLAAFYIIARVAVGDESSTGAKSSVGDVSSTGAKSTSPTSSERASIGATVGIVEGKGFWPCGSSPEAYDELMKWAARRDDSEVKRILVRTRSVGLTSGLRVKILDVGFFKRKVRVLGLLSDGRLYSEDPRTGRECWVSSDALTSK